MWVSLLVSVPLLLHSLGAPLGEPVADDYDFLHHARFHAGEWFDGGGGLFYWRPLARQALYGTFGRLMLDSPGLVAIAQLLMVSLAAVLLYRALRVRWPAPWAAFGATFPFLMESARQLVATPTNVQDLGAILFVAIALHEASRRRMPMALLALLASLLCKEMAVVAAPLLAWVAPHQSRVSDRRMRWTMAALAVVAAWGAVYSWVAHRSGLLFARDLATDAAALGTPWAMRYLWALGQALSDVLSLGEVPTPWRAAIAIAGAALVATGLVALIVRAEVRERLRPHRAMIAAGVIGFLAATATLADLYPEWRSYRSTFGLIGLGVAVGALLAAVHPLLAAGVMVLKLTAFAATPGPPQWVTGLPSARAAAITYPELVRVQRFVGLTRRELMRAYPSVPPGATIGRHVLPRTALYGFSGDRALQVWYGDSTVRWVSFGNFLEDTVSRPVTIVQFEQGAQREIALVDPVAMRTLVRAAGEMERTRWSDAVATLARAESIQTDRGARVFFGIAADRRALALAALGRHAEAGVSARRALSLWPEAAESRYVIARQSASDGRFEEAVGQLDTLLAIAPADSGAAQFRREVAAEIKRRRSVR